MYHHSNLGSFANHVRQYADLDGYVPERGDRHEDMRWDAMTEWDDDSWREHVEGAAEAERQAGQAIAEWRAGR